MSDQTPNTPESGQTPGQSRENADLANELREMAQQLEAAFRAAVESERAKQLRRDLAGGVRELTTQLQTALKSAQDDPRLQQVEERGRDAVSRAQQSPVVQDLQEAIVTGVGQINLQLRKLVDRLEQSSTTSTGTASSTTTQHVPVENAGTTPYTAPTTPATGETTRLNDDDQTTL